MRGVVTSSGVCPRLHDGDRVEEARMLDRFALPNAATAICFS